MMLATFKRYGGITILCTIITVIGYNWDRIFPSPPPNEPSLGQPNPVQTKDGWELKEVNRAHQADSSGFVVAYSSGEGTVAPGGILEGPMENALQLRTRFTKYDGAMLPVWKGRWWKVKAQTGDPKSITVYWIDLGHFRQ